MTPMEAQAQGGTRHELKIWPEYFEPVNAWLKPFEIRLMDREYRVGDVLVLHEFVPDQAPGLQSFTGRVCERTISYISTYEQKPGYAVLGFSLIDAYAQGRRDEQDAIVKRVELLVGKDSGNWNRAITYALEAVRARSAQEAPHA